MIGVSCTGFSSRPVSEWAGPVSETFRLWEIFSEADQRVYLDPDGISRILEEHGLKCQVHAPICDWNIAAMSDRLREASVEETVETIGAASRMGAGLVTVHPGLSSMAVPGLEERAVLRAKDAAKRIDRAAKEHGIAVAMENMPELPFFLGRKAFQLAEIIDETDLSVCFDIGHANTAGQIDDMIDLLGDRIANIHIHDNHGEKDEHLTIGEGCIDFHRVIKRMGGYRGNWIIESKSLGSAVQSFFCLKSMLS